MIKYIIAVCILLLGGCTVYEYPEPYYEYYYYPEPYYEYSIGVLDTYEMVCIEEQPYPGPAYICNYYYDGMCCEWHDSYYGCWEEFCNWDDSCGWEYTGCYI